MSTVAEARGRARPGEAGCEGRRPGFSIVELLVALVIFGVVITMALDVFSQERAAFGEGAARAEATQNLHYAAAILERDLRTAGTNVPVEQPFLVYAGEDIVAFNADYASNIRDPFAVYFDPDAPPGTVSAIQPAQRIQLPGTSVYYPDVTYNTRDGELSHAELLIFFFAPDSTTSRSDDYVLYRQVNDRAPEEVARNILRADTVPFFEYHRLVATGGALSMAPVPAAQVPTRHVTPFHGTPDDTGRVAVVDSIRGVRINMVVTNGRSGSRERRVEIHRMVWLRNAGLAPVTICGEAPLFSSTVQAVVAIDNGKPIVELTWSPSVDETGGEQDVIRYVVWRRSAGSLDRGDPFLSLPAGLPSYVYADGTVEPDSSYIYSVAAQDCTPSLSSIIDSNPVDIGP